MSGWSFPSGKDKAKIPIGSKRFRSEDESKESALDKDSDDSSKEVSDEKKPPVHYEEGGAYYVISEKGNQRRVQINEYEGKIRVSIRDYYNSDDKWKPSGKGISLSLKQWRILENLVPDIDSFIMKLPK